MKIKTREIDITRIGDEDVVEAGIDKESLPFLFEIMSTNFYSNPLGSMIREITSNCFDSHIEASITDPVIVEKLYDPEDDCFYILFKDIGVGLSPDRMLSIYMNYFSSTKRGTDAQLGGFGLGSKTPLSYQDSFYIETIYNGIKYEYIYHKGETKPELDSIHGYDKTIETNINIINGTEVLENVTVLIPLGIETDRGNGTTIKVELAINDAGNTVEEQLRQQLCYFDNVYFKGFNVENDYKIYEGDTFKYKNTSQYSTNMHIVLDKVAYPIDYKLLNIKPVEIPVGVKFHIGELLVNPSRESLRYTEPIKDLIRKRVEECVTELRLKYEGDNPLIQDIFQFILTKTSRTHIKLSDYDRLYIPVRYLPNNTKFRDFDLDIPSNPFFMYEVKGMINYDSEAISRNRWYGNAYEILKPGRDYKIVINHSNNSLYKNAYLAESSDVYIFERKRLSYKEYNNAFGLYLYTRQKRYGQEDNHLSYFDLDDDGVKILPKRGKAILIKKYLNYIDAIVNERVIDYSEVEVPEDWLIAYKKEKYENDRARLRKKNRKIVIKINDSYRDEVLIDDLESRNLIIYKMLHEKNQDLDEAKRLIKTRESLIRIADPRYKDKDLPRSILFMSVAKTNFKQIQHLTNMWHVSQIHRHPMFQKMFRDFGAATYIRHKHLDLNIEEISPYYYKISKYLKKFKKVNISDAVRINRDSIREICKERNLHNYKVETAIKELDAALPVLELSNYLEYNTPDVILKRVFSRTGMTKLNENLYTIKLNENEQEEESTDDSEKDWS